MLSGTTTLLSEQKITSPLGTPERNTTATSRQGLTWWTLDHKPLLSEKENNCHTHKKNLTQSKAEKSDYLWIAFSLWAHFSPLNAFILGQFTCQEAREVPWGAEGKPFSSIFFYSTIFKLTFIHMCVSVNLRLKKIQHS